MNEAARFYEGRSEGLGEDSFDEVQHTVDSILAFSKSGPSYPRTSGEGYCDVFPSGCYTPLSLRS